MWHDRRIIDEVATLGLPSPAEVVINHGSALVVRGVREEHGNGDVDFSTNLENIQYLRELGWNAVSLTVGYKSDGSPQTIISTRDGDGRFDAHRWDFSLIRYKRTGTGRIYLPEQISRSQQDAETGIYVASLEYVRETKLQTDREKDADDIKLVDKILSRA